MAEQAWTTADLPDLSERTAIVTGANRGIGRAVTEALGASGATVIMACRSRDRGELTRQALAETVPAKRLEVRTCDLADLDSVARFAAAVSTEVGAVDLLCNNAGVMAIPYAETTDGFERQFGVNHLGHFALTGHLLPRLLEAPAARIVTQSSGMHERADGLDPAPRTDPDTYDRWAAYVQSKLANVLFARELDRRLEAAGNDALSVSCEPGFVATDLALRGPRQDGSRLTLWGIRIAMRLLAQSPTRGAWSMLRAATDHAIGRGDHVRPGGFLNVRGRPVVEGPSELARSDVLADELWTASVAATGVDFGALR